MSTIIHKKSSVAAKVPLAADLQFGELAINYEDEKLYFKNSAGQVKSWSRNNDVYAKATEAILKGQLVMFAGAQGDHILVSKADLSAVGFIDTWIVGVANQNFAQNDFGDITWFGTVEGIDTSIWPIGTVLYASTTVGGLTATKPTQPSHIIQIAAVTNSHATQGSLIVRPTFGMHLGELHDVYAPSPASGDTIIWNATTNRWETGTGSATDATKLPLAGGTMTGAITFAAAQTWPTFNQNTTGNAATATALQTARTINGVSFNGTANITVADSTKLPLAGGTITGNLAVNGNTTLGDAGTDTVTIKGNLGFGSGPSTNTGIYYRSTAAAMTGSTSGYGIYMDVPFDSGVTVAAEAGRFRVNTAAATYTVTEVSALRLADALKGAGSTITNQYGLSIADLTSGTNNYGILSLVSSGSNKWNIYASGTAANYFAGKTTFGHTNTTNTGQINVLGTVRVVDNATETNALLTTVTNTTSTIETRYSTPLVLGSNATERLRLGTTESVFNEPGGDYDLRVESGTNTHAIFLDAGNSRVGINNSTPTVALDITGDLKASGELVISSVGNNTQPTLNNVRVNGYGILGNRTAPIYITNGGGGGVQIGVGTTHASDSAMLFTASKNTSQKPLYELTDRVLHAGNYNSYALPLSGGTVTGAVSITDASDTLGSSNGSLVVYGSAGIGKNLSISGSFHRAAQLTGSPVEISDVFSVNIETAGTTVIDSWDILDYRSAKYLIQITQGDSYHVSEILVLQDGTTTTMTQYGILESGTTIGNITSDILSGNARLLLTVNDITFFATVCISRTAIYK